jgi:hypothetical protein
MYFLGRKCVQHLRAKTYPKKFSGGIGFLVWSVPAAGCGPPRWPGSGRPRPRSRGGSPPAGSGTSESRPWATSFEGCRRRAAAWIVLDENNCWRLISIWMYQQMIPILYTECISYLGTKVGVTRIHNDVYVQSSFFMHLLSTVSICRDNFEPTRYVNMYHKGDGTWNLTATQQRNISEQSNHFTSFDLSSGHNKKQVCT